MLPLILVLVIVFLSYNVVAIVSITGLNLNSTSNTNTSNENLTCNYNLNSTATSSIVSWYKNSNPTMLLYMPIESNVVNALKDYSGYGSVGTNNGKVLYNSTNGYFTFNTTNYIQISNTSLFTIYTEHTSIVTGKFNDSSHFSSMIYNGDFSDVISSGYPGCYYYGNFNGVENWYYAQSNISIPNNVWYQQACTFNNVTGRINVYVNGVKTGNSSELHGNFVFGGTFPIQLGIENNLDNGWNGSISDARVYNYSLSDLDIYNIYNNLTKIVDSSDLIYNDTWQCKVTSYNSTNVSILYSSNNLKILFGIPKIINLILNSTFLTNTSNENLTCNYALSENATTSSISWYKNNNPLMNLYLPMEGNSTNALLDYSGVGVNVKSTGTIFNATGGFDRKGAYQFNGIDAKLNVTGIPYINNYTITFWAKSKDLPSSGTWKELIGNYFNNVNNIGTLELYNLGGTQYINFYQENTETMRVANPNGVNSWFFVALLCSKNYTYIYLNATFATPTINLTFGKCVINSSIGIGKGLIDADSTFNGTIDDVRIYNSILSPHQILALYNNRTDLIVSQELNVGDTWQCVVTPFTSSKVGITQNSNLLKILPNYSCTISTNTTITNTNLICDVFKILNPVNVYFINSILKFNKSELIDNFAMFLDGDSTLIDTGSVK